LTIVCGPISLDRTLTDELIMRSLLSLRRLTANTDGVTAIEYGLIAALIAIAAIIMMALVGTNLTNTFSTVASAL